MNHLMSESKLNISDIRSGDMVKLKHETCLSYSLSCKDDFMMVWDIPRTSQNTFIIMFYTFNIQLFSLLCFARRGNLEYSKAELAYISRQHFKDINCYDVRLILVNSFESISNEFDQILRIPR